MPNNLAERPQQSDLARRLNMTDAQLELIRRMCVGENAPNDVLELYLAKCRATGCDPLDRLIYVIPRRQRVLDERSGEWRSEIRWTIQGSIDLFRSIAEQTGDYAGQLGPFWSNDGIEWRDVWLDAVPPKVCKIGILRNSFKEPLWVTGTYEYYVPRGSNGVPQPTAFWKGEKGAHQLAKCVEELALRKAFPRRLGGVYGSDEMAQAPKATKLPPRAPAPQEAQDAVFQALPAADEPKPDEYRRKAGIGAVKKLCTDRGVSDALYRSTLLELFDVERFTDKETGEVYPTSKVLDVPDLEHLWRTLNDRTKNES